MSDKITIEIPDSDCPRTITSLREHAERHRALATARELKSTALLVTPEMRAAVHAGLGMLSGVCDGARKIDGAGFNKLDSAIGKKLAMTPVQFLSDRQIVLGAKLVNKYRRQLPDVVVTEATKVFGEKKGDE